MIFLSSYWIDQNAGKFFNDRRKGSLFDQAEVKCFGFRDTDSTRTKEGGYCVIIDTDGDHTYFMFERYSWL
jgi:hypothetical protein